MLVSLHREAHMVGEIVSNVLKLDYPRAKLDIKLILEADDRKTCEAAAALDFPGCVDMVVVPAALPRTKPKAPNYALTFSQGEYVTIYDAEDSPEPNQLRRALVLPLRRVEPISPVSRPGSAFAMGAAAGSAGNLRSNMPACSMSLFPGLIASVSR